MVHPCERMVHLVDCCEMFCLVSAIHPGGGWFTQVDGWLTQVSGWFTQTADGSPGLDGLQIEYSREREFRVDYSGGLGSAGCC